MFQTRELLHRMAYQHKTARAVQHMLTKALVLSGRTLKIPVVKYVIIVVLLLLAYIKLIPYLVMKEL